MGVRGLTKFISDNSQLYLKPYELCNTHVVIDGSSISGKLFDWLMESDSAFGGDYDEYYKICKNFFNALKKCNVTPIVLFDGGYEKKKIKTVLNRRSSKLPELRSLSRNFSTGKFFPLFYKQTFFDVMEDLQIFCVQCEFEADVEIATVAGALNCPVMSYDSDFYIYDVLYISFSSVITEPVRVEESGKVRFYIRCSIYDVNHFLNEFTGLDKSLLPIMATLLGNDYIESNIFENFFNHVIISKKKNQSYTQRKIYGLLHWLKKENVESAIKLILTHVKNKNAKKVLRAINSTQSEYSTKRVSPSVILEMKKLKCGKVDLGKFTLTTKIPSIISKLFYQCRLQKFVIDIISLQSYFTVPLVENVFIQSSYLPAFELIKAIYTLLSPYVVGNSTSLKLYLVNKNRFGVTLLESKSLGICLNDVLNEGVDGRLKSLYDILEMNEEDLIIISKFDGIWTVFIIGMIYWVKKLKNSVKVSHIHALLLMATVNQIAQKNVGYYRKGDKFTKKKGPLLAQLKQTELTPTKVEDDFKKLLSNVTMYECLLVQKMVIPLRQTTEKAKGKDFCILTLHFFASFQTCLYHIMQLNTLLNYPLPHLKISDFYSGTLLFNFYVNIAQKDQISKFGVNFLKDVPNIANIYNYLCTALEKYHEKLEVEETFQKKKRNKKRTVQKKNKELFEIILLPDEESGDDNSGNDDYNDQNNSYFLLQSIC